MSLPLPFVQKTQREEEDGGSEKTKPQVLFLLVLSKSLYCTSRQKKAPRDDDTALSSSKTVGTVGGAVKRDLLSTPFLLNKRAFDATERAFVKLETKRRSSKRFFFRCAPLKFSRRRRPLPFSRFRFKVATTGSLSLSLLSVAKVLVVVVGRLRLSDVKNVTTIIWFLLDDDVGTRRKNARHKVPLFFAFFFVLFLCIPLLP